MTDHTAETEHTSDDVLLDDLLERADVGVLETLSSSVHLDAGPADIFFQHPLRRPARRVRRRTSQEPWERSQATRRP
ncbi:hypothetical protein J7E88_27085 [Streptomyces sp. ISL-10]|uniref:hypothetical protein n=1 Tax=Streptomyces sp. ISL-10 TaxID=2819172 RepID=UPI001BED29A2|nr:hypothetical protein [Streptomyces sp. ISL-10]MBT2368883.1 hypothetical protein [Streptomyces sp. ISL-10]